MRKSISAWFCLSIIIATITTAFTSERNGVRGEWCAGELTEKTYASRWGYGSTDQGSINIISAEEKIKQIGDASIKLNSTSGYDTWLYFPNTKDLDVD